MHQINSLEDLKNSYKEQKNKETEDIIIRTAAFLAIIGIITVLYNILF